MLFAYLVVTVYSAARWRLTDKGKLTVYTVYSINQFIRFHLFLDREGQ